MRPRYQRVIAGVCAAFALAYGWDLALVRVVAVCVLIISCGTAMLLYFAAWIIIPEAPYSLPGTTGAVPGTNGPGSGGPTV
jgi:phage shock protein C